MSSGVTYEQTDTTNYPVIFIGRMYGKRTRKEPRWHDDHRFARRPETDQRDMERDSALVSDPAKQDR